MAKENNDIMNNNKVIYVNFRAQKAKKAESFPSEPTAEEIYALFAPRFGAEFTEWFVDQYKKLEA